MTDAAEINIGIISLRDENIPLNMPKETTLTSG